MKKISLLLAIVMLFSVFSVGVSAEAMPKLSTSVAKTENNAFDLVLNLSEDSHIAGCSFNIVYDSKKLTYVGHEVKGPLASLLNFVNPNYNANAIRVLWAGTDALTDGGEILKVTFTVKDGAFGSTDIVIDKLMMMDVSSETVDCTFENATVLISEEPPADEEVNDAPLEDEDETTPSAGNENAGDTTTNDVPTSGTTTPEQGETGKPTDDDKENVAEKPENEEPKDSSISFADVKETDWYFESVKFANANRLMSGVSETEFAPMNHLTRGMLVTILYRLEKEPDCSASTFSDVEDGMWYTKGIAWAAENNVVSGVGDNQFAPNSNITREQIALIMYNYSNLHAFDTKESKSVAEFKDANSVSAWAKEAVEWAVGAGLLSGKGDGILDPKGNATRAEIATILMRYVEKYRKSGCELM